MYLHLRHERYSNRHPSATGEILIKSIPEIDHRRTKFRSTDKSNVFHIPSFHRSFLPLCWKKILEKTSARSRHFRASRVTRLRHNAHFHTRDISRQSCLLVKDPKIHPPELESSSFALVISTMGTSHVPRVVEISIPHTEWIVSLSLPLSLSLSLCGGGSRVQFASGRRGGSVYSARFKPWRLYGCVSLSLGDDGRESSR